MNKREIFREDVVDGAILLIAILTIMMVGFFIGYSFGRLTTPINESPGKIIIEHKYPEGDNGDR